MMPATPTRIEKSLFFSLVNYNKISICKGLQMYFINSIDFFFKFEFKSVHKRHSTKITDNLDFFHHRIMI